MNDTLSRPGLNAEEELAALREKVETLMAERVAPAIGAVAGQAEALATAASDRVRDEAQRLGERVQQQPLMAVGIAALAGFVLAALIRR